MNEKIYYIPKRLNRQFELLLGYTLKECALFAMLGVAGVAVAYYTGYLVQFIPLVLLAVLKYRWGDRTVGKELSIRLSYFLTPHSHTYTLFEKERRAINGND